MENLDYNLNSRNSDPQNTETDFAYKNQNEPIDLEKENFKNLMRDEVKKIVKAPEFLLENQGGMERYANRSYIPELLCSPKSVSVGLKSTFDYLVKENISTQKQLNLLNAIKLSLSDLKLLADDENTDYEYIQFAYKLAGLVRDEWNLSQKQINDILNTTKETFKTESLRGDISYIVSLYIKDDSIFFKQSKIDRFMENMTPNLIDNGNHIYHFDSTDNKSIFLRLDTKEKLSFVEKELSEYKIGWNKMFNEYPTVKTDTHYDLPEEFKEFVIPDNEIKEYFPHISFSENNDVLREDMKNMLNPIFRKSFYNDTGVDLNELGPEQAYLVEYISGKKAAEILPFKTFVKNFGKEGIKTFLSCAHDRMGDKILHLSENLPENEAIEVFNGYGNLIDNTNTLGNKISKHIEIVKKNNLIPEGIDIAKLPNELMNALMLRAKDVLVGADKVLENQLAGAEEKLNTKDVTDAVLGINTLVSILSNIGEQSDYVYKKIDSIGNKPGETLTKYIVTDASGIEYALKIFIRPKAEKDAQARVNIELSFDTEKPNERLQKAFYNETVNHKENKTSAGSVLRIGIDRDDFNHTGAVSLDLGRSERNTERYSRTGDVLGKLLSMTSAEGHHETSAFSKEFADEKVFESVTTMLAGYFANQETS